MAAIQEKKKRTTAKSNFSRNVNKLQKLFNDASPAVLVTPQFEKMSRCYEELEAAHNEFLAVTDINIEVDKDGLAYIDEPDATHEAIVAQYSTYLKRTTEQQHEIERLAKLEEDNKQKEERKMLEEEARGAEETRYIQDQKRKFDSEKAQLDLSIDAFKRLTLNFKEALVDISVVDRRQEWQKVEMEFSQLKKQFVQVVGIDGALAVEDISASFQKNAEDVFLEVQKQFLIEQKDVPPTSGGVVPSVSVSTSSSSLVKREPVRLPRFFGDESQSPYLKFPIWKKQWNVMIADYEEQFRPGVLLEYLDEAACSKFIGYETDYEEAMKRLSLFYGDSTKVIQCVLKEVLLTGEIVEGNYKELVEYGVILENNFNRLTAMNLEHEISNTSTMTSILRKFPRTVRESWLDHLSLQEQHLKMKPFPVLIEWLKSRKETWENMAAVDVSISNTSDSLSGSAFFGLENPGFSQKKCYGCDEEGHIHKNCPKNNTQQGQNQSREPKNRRKPTVKKFWCALHKGDTKRRCFSDSCQDLRRTEVQKRIQLLQENMDCFHCTGDHLPTDCPKKERVCGGTKDDRGCRRSHNVHELFCVEAKVFSVQHVQSMVGLKENSGGVVLLIMQVRSSKKGVTASVFWDNGCTSNFVREEYAKSCGFKGTKENLSVTTLGGVVSDYVSVMTYKCSLIDVNGQIEYFEAYGMETITGAVTKIGYPKIHQLFPHLSDRDIRSLQRVDRVDVLVGIGQPSWHPERTELARGGGDFWLYRGRFGSCVGGRHPSIVEETRKSDSLFVKVHQNFATQVSRHQPGSHELEFCPQRCEKYNDMSSTVDVGIGGSVASIISSVRAFASEVEAGTVDPVSTRGVEPVANAAAKISIPNKDIYCECSLVRSNKSAMCYGIKASPLTDGDLFFESQAIGTVIQPLCGSCRCTKCPIPGMKFNFKDQQEYDVIQSKLFYDEELKCWFVEYPWLNERSVLPRNEKGAYQSLCSLENSLQKKPKRSEKFCQKIRAMVELGAAIELTLEELQSWDGDFHYLPVLGVVKDEDLRIVFDAARKQWGCPSMNECIMKGPDCFMNNLGAVLVGFRNGRVAAVADIRKFHNQVRLVKKDVHMQRFLWRDMKTDEPPKTFAVAVNNFGVRSAGCIATSALHKSADLFSKIYPVESQLIKDQLYVDDELVAAENMNELRTITSRMDEICQHASMPNKGWRFSGDKDVTEMNIGGKDDKVLGLSYNPSSDSFNFRVILKLKTTQGEVSISSPNDLEAVRHDLVLTRRVLLANVSRVFDPLGLVTPILLESKLLMRESWCGKIVGWDEPLPVDQQIRWLEFLFSLLALGDIKFARSLWPQEEVIGQPTLVIFSDGAVLAFGAAAYIHWELKAGGYWNRLIMAKSRIAPKNIVSIPRMELNGAVIGNRMKNFILNETNLKFSHVYQLVDSSTVLGYVQKECGAFKPYEGVRVAEIQSSNKFVNGTLVGWAWVAGQDNPADWCTKSRGISDIQNNSIWVEGPEFLKNEEALWPLKFTYKKDNFEGQLQVPKSVKCLHVQVHHGDFLSCLINRSSSWTKLTRVFAWIMRLVDMWYFRFTAPKPLDADEIKRAKIILLKYAQRGLISELNNAVNSGKGKFRKLAPYVDDDGVWRVGSRMSIVPFTLDALHPALLPHDHRITLLIMLKAHQHSHVAQDGTTARFRAIGYWTPRCGHLAKGVADKCVTCRKLNRRMLNQQMGAIPEDRLQDPFAWGVCQLDLFGPFSCRGDVNPRTTKKTWGMVVEDVNSGAVHLDVIQDYSAEAVIKTLRRFGALRGWPSAINSDPGSQLESAGGKLEEWWLSFGNSLLTYAGAKNFKWNVSPADSPWRQGKAERRIAIVKRCISFSMGDSRVTPLELQTILFEIADICNERPLGAAKPRADGTYALITPNDLLMGRSCNKLPDDEDLTMSSPMASRYRLIHHVTSQFWKRWSSEVSPSLVVRQKWHSKSRNLTVGDLVMICEPTKLKSRYKQGIVDAVTLSNDGNVRSATIRYVIVQNNSKGDDCVRIIRVTRSVQRLVLILPVEEQCASLEVRVSESTVQCATKL